MIAATTRFRTSRTNLTHRLLVLLVATTALGGAAGCMTPVAPYERAKLAHPTMVADPGGHGESHLRAITEGAIGGSGGTGSGCGCN